MLQVTGNSSSRTWGSAGRNGANCIFTASNQILPGDVVYDTISNLDLYLTEGSTLEGAFILNDEPNGGYSGDGVANVTIDASSTWVVTGDSYISGTLACAGTIENAKIVDASGAVLYGDGAYTVTVGALTGDVDVSGAGEIPVWEDYAVENPFASASGEPSGSDEAPAGGYSADEAGYQAYLKDWVAANPAVQANIDEFNAQIESGDYVSFPLEMCFTDQWFGFAALTLDQFIAAGGVAEIPAFDPTLAPD